MGICKNQVSTCLLKDIVMIVHPTLFFFFFGKAPFSSTFLISSFDKNLWVKEGESQRQMSQGRWKCKLKGLDVSKAPRVPKSQGYSSLASGLSPQWFSEAESEFVGLLSVHLRILQAV